MRRKWTGIVGEPSTDRLFNRETDFIAWLTSLLIKNPEFSQVTLEPLLNRPGATELPFARADVMAVRTNKDGQQTLLIECKNRPLYGRLVDQAIKNLKRYGTLRQDARLVLAIPGRMADVDRARIRRENIELWDLDTILSVFGGQIEDAWPERTIGSAPTESPEKKLIRELQECPPGKPHWSIFQKLVGRVLEHCFCPPLNAPLSEAPDESGTNRRDFILANFAESGFWSYIRSRYSADYIVVDAKNHASKVKKLHVLQMANYLKHHGTGLFGIIFSRHGGDNSARITAREQWAIHQKLIIVLDDQKCEAMINGALSGEATQVLAKEIQDFRLSM